MQIITQRREEAMTLKEAREAAGLTQRDLAKLARVCRASISHIENKRYAPSVRFAGKICRALSAHLGCVLHTWQLFPGYFCELELDADAGQGISLNLRGAKAGAKRGVRS
jgi:DNA-binding XRE family transcriptional regulator